MVCLAGYGPKVNKEMFFGYLQKNYFIFFRSFEVCLKSNPCSIFVSFLSDKFLFTFCFPMIQHFFVFFAGIMTMRRQFWTLLKSWMKSSVWEDWGDTLNKWVKMYSFKFNQITISLFKSECMYVTDSRCWVGRTNFVSSIHRVLL